MDAARPITDADREVAVAALRAHAGTGRIDLDQFGERTERVLAARTVADLQAVFADLPGGELALAASEPAPAAPAVPDGAVVPYRLRRIGVPPRLAPVVPWAVLFVAIWALTGFGYFWPAWPILGISIGALKRGHCWGPRRRAYWA